MSAQKSTSNINNFQIYIFILSPKTFMSLLNTDDFVIVSIYWDKKSFSNSSTSLSFN